MMRFKFIVPFLLATTAPTVYAQSYLTLHFTHSPRGIDWKNPQTLAVSVLRNTIAPVRASRHAIGHVRIELKCGDSYLMTGMTNKYGSDTRDAVLKDGYGLGVVLKTYRGELEQTEKIFSKQQKLLEIGRASFIKFLIKDSTCDRLHEYLKEYKENGYDQMYSGLHAFPLYRQGSGCSAFGASFLELSGLQIPEFEDKWMRHNLILPYQYIGNPAEGKKLNFFKLLFSLRARWGSNDSDGVKITFWDPDLMHNWIVKTHKTLTNNPSLAEGRFPWPLVKLQRIKKGRGMIFDARSIPTPTGPIFKN